MNDHFDSIFYLFIIGVLLLWAACFPRGSTLDWRAFRWGRAGVTPIQIRPHLGLIWAAIYTIFLILTKIFVRPELMYIANSYGFNLATFVSVFVFRKPGLIDLFPKLNDLWCGFLGVCIIWPIMAFSAQLTSILIHQIEPEFVFELDRQVWISQIGSRDPFLERLLLAFLLIFVVPIGEEVFFRYFLYRALKSILPALGAAFMSAIIFAILHGMLIQGTSLLLMGLFLCYLYERTRSLWSCILLHMLFNAHSFLSIQFESKSF